MRESSSPFASGIPATARSHDREDNLQAAADKLGRHLFETHCRIVVFGPQTDAQAAGAQIQRIAGAFAHFTLPRMATFRVSPVRRHGTRDHSRGRGFLLSAEELATLWHPATTTVRAPAMQTTQCRELEPPPLLPRGHHEPDIALLGRTKFRGRREVFGLRTDDRRRHLAVIGKTGMGKTTLLRQLIASDIAAGRGLALIDPHGDLAQTILDAVPPHRTNDVVLFDAGDRDFPLAFNPPTASRIGPTARGIQAPAEPAPADPRTSRGRVLLAGNQVTVQLRRKRTVGSFVPQNVWANWKHCDDICSLRQ